MRRTDRKRQVKTTKLRHGKDFYERQGSKPHRRGFSDPEVARQAALKSHEQRRLKKEQEDASNVDNQENQSST